MNQNKLFVASVEKALRLLQAFNTGQQYLSLNELVEISNLNKSAVQRFSYTLESIGYLEKDKKTKQYKLTAKSMDIAYSYLRSNPLIEIATPRILEFRNRFGLTVNLSVRNDAQLIYILRIPAPDQSFIATLTGRRTFLYSSAGGRIFMSRLPEEEQKEILKMSNLEKITPFTNVDPRSILNIIKEGGEKGYCVNNQECLLGEIVISSAITDADDKPMAVVHVPVSTKEWTVKKFEKQMSNEIVNLARSIRVY